MVFYLHTHKKWRYFMKITLSQLIIILVFTGISYAANGVAQGILNNSVTIDNQNTSLKDVLNQLGESAHTKFVYSGSKIDVNQMVQVSAKDEKLEKILNDLLVTRGIQYKVIGTQIVLSNDKSADARSPAIVNNNSSTAADIVVTGRITDENNEVLIGVVIKVKGTTLGATTNVNGDYTLRIPDTQTNPVLQVTYIGYITQEIAVAGKTKIDIQLKQDTKALEEVVVVGYNTIKKSDVTGAVISVTEDDIRSRPVANALEAMQGKAAGVDIQSTQRPGTVGSIQIRGQRSITAGRDPLYVVDGVPLAAGGIEAIIPTTFSPSTS